MTSEELLELRPGDRLLVNPASPCPPGPWLAEQAIFVAWLTDEASGIPVLMVCGLADGWDGQPNLPLGLRAVWQQNVLGRCSEDDRIELLRRRLRQMARVLA